MLGAALVGYSNGISGPYCAYRLASKYSLVLTHMDRVCGWMQSNDRVFLITRNIVQNEDSTSTYAPRDYQDSIR
jgi:hypothetical protein